MLSQNFRMLEWFRVEHRVPERRSKWTDYFGGDIRQLCFLAKVFEKFLYGFRRMKRWRDYLKEVSTANFPHPVIPSAAPVHGLNQTITVEETEPTTKKMRQAKAIGPNDEAVGLWNSEFGTLQNACQGSLVR